MPYFDVDFKDLLETFENVTDVLLEVKIDFVLTDSRYSVRYKHNMDHSSHDIFTLADMSDLGELGHQVLVTRAHLYVF